MQNYTPISIAKSWKNRFLGNHLQHLLSKVKCHENNISLFCKKPNTALFKRIYEDAFWENLKTLSPKKEEITECHEIWKKIRPLAHLNSKQLISLLREEVLPLERHYNLTLEAFKNENIEVEAQEFLPSNWLYPSTAQYTVKIQENQEKLLRLKLIIYDSLLWRCQAHTLLNSPRNVDDIVAALCTKLNLLDLLKPSLEIKNPLSSTLDDDRRLTIYDCLSSSVLDKDELQVKILASIPKQGHAAFISAKDIKDGFKQVKKFQKQTINDLAAGKIIGNSWVKKVIPSVLRKTSTDMYQGIKDGLYKLGVLSFFLKLWSFRYIAYIALTFIAYHYLMLVLSPPLTALLGAATSALIDSIIFYGLALSPVWVLGWNLLVSFKNSFNNYVTHWKKEDIYRSLDTLVESQDFIANHLSQVIIDIPHFDIQHVTEQAGLHQAKLAEAKTKLAHFFMGERFLCRGVTVTKTELTLAKLDNQSSQLITNLKQVANHISLRVGDDIELLERNLAKNQLSVIIQAQQLDKLKHFVTTFGDATALNQFKQNSNPLNKWMSKIERCSRAQNSNDHTLTQPWGGRVSRNDYINGWEIILQGYMAEGSELEAALQLNSLLAGKYHPTSVQLEHLVNQLGMGEKKPQLLQKIKDHLFNTLNSRNPQNARLLCEQHKELIARWYQQHQEQIKRAEREMTRLFAVKKDDALVQRLDRVGDEELSNIYELLDGADIYTYSSEQAGELSQRKNLARQYFENYQGESSRAIRFLRFIPEAEQKSMLIDIAKKRIAWLLEHSEKRVDPIKPFDDADTELFHDYRLIEASDEFDFTSFVTQSKQFNNAWDQNVETFLDACRRNGFDSGKLLKNYKEKNERVKPFILHQHENGKKTTSCHTEELKDFSHSSKASKRRTIRVTH